MSRDTQQPTHRKSITRHRTPTSRRFRLALPGVTALLLLTGLAGGAQLGPERQPGAGTVAAGIAPAPELPPVQAAELRRFEAAYERADRQRRVAEQQEAQRIPRGDEAPPSPEPEPEPEPEAPSGNSDSGAGEPAGPAPEACSDYSGNRETGCTLLLDQGFSLDQMSCLDNLWTRESGWDHTARNPSSGAYGIPQSLPGNKMADAGSDWETNPATQIRWGLGYIENRYGTPCGAWQFFQNNNWY